MQEFSSDMNSHAVKRIEDVRLLRSTQFPEDAGPLAHPVRPESYIKMDNFYTSTVYHKVRSAPLFDCSLLLRFSSPSMKLPGNFCGASVELPWRQSRIKQWHRLQRSLVWKYPSARWASEDSWTNCQTKAKSHQDSCRNCAKDTGHWNGLFHLPSIDSRCSRDGTTPKVWRHQQSPQTCGLHKTMIVT